MSMQLEFYETYRVTDGDDRREFANKFDALRYAVRSEGMTEVSLWRHRGERLANGFVYKGEDSLKMVDRVVLNANADHPWLTLYGETWNRLAEAVATDIARCTGLYLDGLECWQNAQEYIDKAEQHMTDSGLKPGAYL